MTATHTYDSLIIGGGIIGMLTARELHQRGQSVCILEKSLTGSESSWAGGGILSPLYPWRYDDAVNALAKWSQAMYANLCDELHQESGIDSQWTQSGMLITDMFTHEEQSDINTWSGKFSSNIQHLVKTDIDQVQAGLGEQHHNAIYLPDIAQVRNPRLVKALRQALLSSGVKIVESTEVKQILVENDIALGTETSQGQYHADSIVIASGAWSASLLSALNTRLDVKPMRGQMLLFKADPGMLDRIILHDGRYLIPRRDGRILIGSTLEDVGFDKSTTQQARASLLESALAILPALQHVDIEHHWSGLRPGSTNGVPVVCAHPGISGLYINAGHYRNGVVMGPASARLMANIITDEPPILQPEPYHI